MPAQPDAESELYASHIHHHAVDGMGRARAYLTQPVSLDAHLRTCRALDAYTQRAGGSRWSLRGLVDSPVSPRDVADLLAFDTVIEVSQAPTVVDGRTLACLWTARNSPDRLPARHIRDDVFREIQHVRAYQRELDPVFHERALAMLGRARDHGLSLVCNDPFGDWGFGAVDVEMFVRLLTHFFYVDAETAHRMAHGHGYSTGGNYVFGMNGPDGQLMCVFVMAVWPWGLEPTYTIIDRTQLGPVVDLKVASVLMLLANALVVDRHGRDTLVIGEANSLNARPCIQAGFEPLRQVFDDGPHPVHTNVVWADNPLGDFSAPYGSATRIPGYREVPYTNYGVGVLAPRKVEPFHDTALEFLAAARS
ncbi:hypothetical protein OHA74_55160 [Streptomyces phaeochromogenes]|uniref:hypothetical protein n=1 Tax=Streptomyces phaeochromogenes TaxID=1923 RepID=UPI002E286915|nr:hypothetical protein [Streptomyces phaeochromogenes]